MQPTGSELVKAAQALRRALAPLRFAPPVTHVYNPLIYAWKTHQDYLLRYGNTPKRIVIFGMNPGPWGMVQTGIPFGEVNLVKSWLCIEANIDQPAHVHPARPVLGFACRRSEVSGLRLWGLFRQRFQTPAAFFEHHFVANYCPLAFMEASGRNRTPDKLPANEQRPLLAACDSHLKRTVAILNPEWLVCVGGFAEKRARALFPGGERRIAPILHPSPANPAANEDWAGKAVKTLQQLGVWPKA
jgi:single-strand selective monofunctional uracil DNA glycosylase